MNDTKIINSRCVCGIGLGWNRDQIIMLDPCEHMIHKKCCVNFIECPICKTRIIKKYTEKKLKILAQNDTNYNQKYIDMICVKNTDDKCKKNMSRFIMNVPTIMDLIGRIPFSKGFDNGHKLCKNTLMLSNVKLTVIGKKNITKDNKIIIANHSSIMDFMIMFYVFKCGFLASNSVKESWLGKMISSIIPILFIDRGKDTNTVDKMKQYISEQGSLCLFPEGIIVHPQTLARFRTGAFHAGQPILPVVIKYKPHITDGSIGEFLQKMASQDQIHVTVHVLPLEIPPFDNQNIVDIRQKMANIGNMSLSRVSNRDAIDNKKYD